MSPYYWTKERLIELHNLLYESPLSLKEIAKHFESNVSALRNIIYNNKLKIPDNKKNIRKVTASDIIIISLMIDKFSASVIAKRIGCSRRTIQRYIREIKEKRKQ